jgi:hypothetical protein
MHCRIGLAILCLALGVVDARGGEPMVLLNSATAGFFVFPQTDPNLSGTGSTGGTVGLANSAGLILPEELLSSSALGSSGSSSLFDPELPPVPTAVLSPGGTDALNPIPGPTLPTSPGSSTPPPPQTFGEDEESPPGSSPTVSSPPAFEGKGDGGSFVANPEPASLALGSLGVLSIAGFFWRRRKTLG